MKTNQQKDKKVLTFKEISTALCMQRALTEVIGENTEKILNLCGKFKTE